MFSTKRKGQDSVVEVTKNVSVWESLIEDLSDDTYVDDSSDDHETLAAAAGPVHDAMPLPLPIMVSGFSVDRADRTKLSNSFFFNNKIASDKKTSSLFFDSAQVEGNGSRQPDVNNSVAELKYPAMLRDWIHYHAKKQPATVNYLGVKMDKAYILSATKVALSLSKKLGRQFETKDSSLLIHCHDITVDNVCVTNAQDCDAYFSPMDFSPRGSSGVQKHFMSNNSERKQILALGLILYEVFTQGSLPPQRFQQLNQSSGGLSFASSLRISDDEHSVSVDDNKSAETAHFSRRQRRRCDEGKEKSVAVMLQLAGVPSSVCRLVSDMLSNRDDAEFGTLFQYDKSASCFTDVILDLNQKSEKPVDFLWDTVRLSAKPTIRNKLYFREKELEQGTALAERATSYRRGRMIVAEEGSLLQAEASIKQEVLLITGHSGSGKSCLAEELIVQLAKRGWDNLHCKFDQLARRKPLSTIASAFDLLFSSLLTREKARESSRLESIRANIIQSLDEESLSILFEYIPNLRHAMTDDDSQKEQIEYMFDACDTIASKCRMHHWFYSLLTSISRDTPVLLFLDDLHWADIASLELITFIVDEMGASIAEDASNAESTNVFIVGTFRSNEIDNSKGLQNCLQQMQGCCNVSVTEIAVQDLSSSDVNLMISEALCYSQRLTRSLADIVHQKTVGNPFFVKEFLNDLTVENLLVYSFSQRMWEWNEDLIESRIISDGVAEILIRKLRRLPKDQLSGLTMLSCFGSEVSLEVLNLVKNSYGRLDILQSLDCIAQAGLVKRTDEKYCFVHDMILHAARTIDENERMIMMKWLLQTLVMRTSENCDDAILFIIVDLISRIGPNRIHDAKSRMLYANLNLTAATKAIQAADFASASACIECGISLLDVGHWEHSYRLSLDLFNHSALAEWAQGNTERMTKSIDEVFNNAKSIDDKLRAAEIKLDYQGMTGTLGFQPNALGFDVLEQLGECFPSSPKNEIIAQELLDTKQRLGGLSESSLGSLPIMSDSKKIQTMALLENAVIRCYQWHSKYFCLIACRMVRITLQYGSSKYSSFGFSATALCFVSVFGDFAGGSALARMSLSLLKIHNNSRLLTDTYTMVYGTVLLWRDPLQSVLPHLLDAYRIAEKSGYVGTTGHASAMFYSYRAFFSGLQLSSLGKEVAQFMRKSERDNRHVMTLSFLPVSKGISHIMGGSTTLHTNDSIEDEELDQVVNDQGLVVLECYLVIRLCCDIVFRRFDALKSIARKYLEYLERCGNGIAQYVNIPRHFYGGLISLHFYRENHDQFWLDIATHSISKLETWVAESVWNFENKLLLLQAENHYAFGEMEDAATKYRLAIESSHTHRFVHEEALACEQAATFHMEIGNSDLADDLMKRALECYRTWGAEKKVELLERQLTKRDN